MSNDAISLILTRLRPGLDVRQGPLPIQQDPLATLAERSTVAAPMREEELIQFLAPRPDIPALIAYRGFTSVFTDMPSYYLDETGTYRDCQTDEPWSARKT